MNQTLPNLIGAVVASVLLSACAGPGPRPQASSKPADVRAPHWVASWGSAQQIPEPHNALPAEQLRDASLRQIVRVSIGGTQLRVRISNAFGTAPLLIADASLAQAVAAGRADVDGASVRPLTFGGQRSTTIPAGAEYTSDAVLMPHAPSTDLAVTLYLPDTPARQTSHPGSRTTSFVAKGNKVQDASWPEAAKVVHWYQLSDVEVLAAPDVHAIVVLGDSLTDGYGSTTDGNNRWTDFLVQRLTAESARTGAPALAVLNAGLGGGRMLKDGLGPNLVARFDRDVLTRAATSHAIVLIGVNDLGVLRKSKQDTPEQRAQLLQEMRTALQQLATRAHSHRRCVIGGTILPFVGSNYYEPDAGTDADRRSLNDWIRNSGVFDAVIDFDAALRDPAQPDRLRAEFDLGDHLHLSPTGNRALADAVPTSALRDCAFR